MVKMGIYTQMTIDLIFHKTGGVLAFKNKENTKVEPFSKRGVLFKAHLPHQPFAPLISGITRISFVFKLVSISSENIVPQHMKCINVIDNFVNEIELQQVTDAIDRSSWKHVGNLRGNKGITCWCAEMIKEKPLGRQLVSKLEKLFNKKYEDKSATFDRFRPKKSENYHPRISTTSTFSPRVSRTGESVSNFKKPT